MKNIKSPIFWPSYKPQFFVPLSTKFTLGPSPIFYVLLMDPIEGQLLAQLEFCKTFFLIFYLLE